MPTRTPAPAPPPTKPRPLQDFVKKVTKGRFIGRPLSRRPVLKLSSLLVGLGSLLALALLLLTSQKFIIQPLLTSIIPSQPNLTILEPENATVTAPMAVGTDQAASGSKYIFTSVTNTAAKSSSLAQTPTANKVLANTNLSIAVSGNHLVNGSGSTVHLHGVNRSGTEYACFQFGISDGPLDDASVTAMASWGINVVRIPLNEDCWLGINGFPKFNTTAQYQQAIVNYVNTLNTHGIYAWLDLQMVATAADQSTTILPMPDTDHAPAFWTSITNTFKANPAVVFDLYNEPHDVPWPCWANGCQVTSGFNFVHAYQAAGMSQLVSTIRSTGATNVINVAGLSWSYDLSGWLANRPNDNQLIAGVHNYGATGFNTQANWDTLYTPVSQQVPVVWGEMGEEDCAPTYINQVMPWADSRGIGYLAWTWDTWGTCEALISNYNGTPTNYGSGLKAHLATLAPPAPSPPPSPNPTPPPPAAPSPLPTNTGSATMTFSVATAGQYTVWSRIQAADANSDSFWLQIDGGSGVKVGDGGVSFGPWVWINHQNGNTASRVLVNLTSGSHTLKIIGREANTKIDAIILTQDLSFNPDNPAVVDSTPPVVTISSPANNANLSGTITVSVQAADDHAVSKVDLLLDNNTLATQPANGSGNYSFTLDTTKFASGSHSLVAKATDIAGNVGSSSILTINTSQPSPPPPPSPTPPPPAPITGDLNGDSKVNILDISILLRNWNTLGGSSDLNHDGVVNIIDFSILLRNWAP